MSYQITLEPQDGDLVVVVRSALEALRLAKRYAPTAMAGVSIETLGGERLSMAELEARALSEIVDAPAWA